MVTWDGINRRHVPADEPANQDIINLFREHARADEDWRRDNARKQDALLKTFEDFRKAHEPTLLRLTERAAYWAGIRDEVVKKLLTAGVISATIVVLAILWQSFKEHMRP